MALLEVKTSYATYTDCTLRVGQYQMDGSIAVEIFSRREGPVARITVCLCDSALAENEAYVDTNNCPWVVDFLEAKGLAKSTGRTRRSGYCIYPSMKFDREKMAKGKGSGKKENQSDIKRKQCQKKRISGEYYFGENQPG